MQCQHWLCWCWSHWCENTTFKVFLHTAAKLRLWIKALPQCQMPTLALSCTAGSAGPHLGFCLSMLTTSCTTHASTCVTVFWKCPAVSLHSQMEHCRTTGVGCLYHASRKTQKYITIPTKSSGGLEQYIKCIKAWAFHSTCEEFLLPLWRHSLIWSVHVSKEEQFLIQERYRKAHMLIFVPYIF